MPSATDWYNLFNTQTTAINSLAAKIAALQSDLTGIRTAVKSANDPNAATLVQALGSIPAQLAYQLNAVKVAIEELPHGTAGGGGSVSIDLAPLVQQLGQLQLQVKHDLETISSGMADVALLLSTEGADSAILAIKDSIATQTQALTQIATLIASGAGAGGGMDLGPLVEALSSALGSGGRTLADLIVELLSPASAEAAELDPSQLTALGQFFQEHRLAAKAQREAYGEHSFASITDGAKALLAKIIAGGADAAQTVMEPLGILFEGITTAGVQQILDGMAADFADQAKSPRDRALGALTRAYKLGQQAHFLASAVEAFHPLHEFGLSNAAAAITDLSGFAPISQAVFRAYLDTSIAIPNRQQTNAIFTPEIPNVNVLSDFVRRRTIKEEEYKVGLRFHGFNEGWAARFVDTVWRDPTIRDLALALEDTTTPLDWLRERVKKAGYDDVDAERLTAALIQRSNKGVRDRVRSAAVSAYAEGTIDRDELDATLHQLQMTDTQRAMELVAADLQRRRDAVKDALATYRKQYVNDVIDEADYRLAITALGVDPSRIDGIVADANAAKAPKIAAEEERQIKQAIRQVQTELVPRIRKLFELGQVSADTYRQTLIDAGISEQVATQAVSLDAARLRAVENQRAAGEVQAAVDQATNDRRDLLVAQFRAEQLTESQLRQALLDTGLPADLTDTIVSRERVRAKSGLSDLQRALYVEQYQKGVIDDLGLRSQLTSIGLTAEEVNATVALERTKRLATPKPLPQASPTTPPR
jgi:hypothetical protein